MAAILIPDLRLKLDFIYQKHPYIHNNQQLAQAMGLKASNISQWRHGLRENLIPEKRLWVLCDVLGVDKQLLLAPDIHQFYHGYREGVREGVDQSCPYEFKADTFSQHFHHLGQLMSERAPILSSELEMYQKVLERYYQTPWQALGHAAKKEFSQAFYDLESLCQRVINISLKEFLADTILPKYDLRCPFPGLCAFNEEQADFFFGRDDNIKHIVQYVQQHRCTILVGPSGCGKSSIALAGVLPYFRQHHKTFDYLVMSPGQTPDTTFNNLFHSDLTKPRNPYFIIIDQLEELFSLSVDAQRQAFITRLHQLIHGNDLNIHVLATLRSDFLEPCFQYPKLIQLLSDHQILIKPLTAEHLLSVIEKQASSVDFSIDPHITESLRHELKGQLNVMPLVQHLMYQLWLRRVNRRLNYQAYQSLGGLQKSIATSAEDFYNALCHADKKRCQHLFLRLTRLGQYQSDYIINTKNRINIEQLGSSNEFSPLLEKMIKQRLLIIQESAKKKTIEVSHEALLQHWPRLKRWLVENQEALQVHNQIASFSLEWTNKNKDTALLLEGNRLTKINRALKIYDLTLNQIEQQFIDDSNAQNEQVLRLAEQKNRIINRHIKLRNYALASLGVIVVSLALLSTGFAIKSHHHEQQSVTAHSNAEQLMTYMVNDLVIQLEKVGRLDILSNTVVKIDDYFNKTSAVEFDVEQTIQKLNLLHSAGHLKKKLGQLKQSLTTYKKMEATAIEALTQNQNKKALHLLLASAYFGQAQMYLDKQELVSAKKYFILQKTSAEKALIIWPDDIDLLQEIATSLHNLGVVSYQEKNYDSAIYLLNQALENKKIIMEKDDNTSIVKRQTLANTHALLAAVYRETSNYQLSQIQLSEAEQLLIRCLESEPNNAKLAAQFVRLLQSKGNLFSQLNQIDRALETYQFALTQVDAMIDQDDKDATLHSLRAVIVLSVGKMFLKKQMNDQALTVMDRYYGKFYDYLISHNNNGYEIDQYSLDMVTQMTLILSTIYENIDQSGLSINSLTRTKILLQSTKLSNTASFIKMINSRIISLSK